MFSEFIKNINSWVRDILEMLQNYATTNCNDSTIPFNSSLEFNFLSISSLHDDIFPSAYIKNPNLLILPEQCLRLHDWRVYDVSGHSFPPYAGDGLLHERTRIIYPSPQVFEQVDHDFQLDHSPSTVS